MTVTFQQAPSNGCSPFGVRADYRWLPGGHVSSIAESSHVIDAITEALALD